MSAQKQPSGHASVPERWNCHPLHARVDLEQREQEQELEQQVRGLSMTEKLLLEAEYVHLRSMGHRRKLGQALLLTDWQMVEGKTGKHYEAVKDGLRTSQAYPADSGGRTSLLLRWGLRAARGPQMAHQDPLAGPASQGRCAGLKESLALKQQVAAERTMSEMGEATHPATIDGPFVA